MPERSRQEIYPFDIRLSPLEPPQVGIFDSPTVSLCINREWASHIQGLLHRLLRYDAWQGDFEAQYSATQEIQKFVITFQDGMQCMVDFCCDETNQSLSVIINNQATIISQNLTTQYNTHVQNNLDMRTLNVMLYDGTPQSINPNLGDNFGGTAALENALCLALKRFLEQQMYTVTMEAAIAAGVTTAAIAGLIALAPLTLGMSVAVGFTAAALLGASYAMLEAALNDSEAQKKVLCCLFDNLKDKTITLENFQTLADGCSFEENSNEETILHQMWIAVTTYPENYLAFLRLLGDSNNGDRNDCECCDEIVEYDLIALNDCVITRLNDFQWRVQQATYTQPDPLHPEERVYVVEFEESQQRCLDVIGYTESMMSYRQTDCRGVVIEGIGGGGGVGKRYRFIHGQNTDYHDIDATITVGCPNVQFNP